MSSNFETVADISCAEFESLFDGYVDAVLGGADQSRASRHIASCSCCDREVTRWQQTRILLSTAVADYATAVDVSTLRRDVEAALGFGDAEAAPLRDRDALLERRRSARRSDSRRAASSPARRRLSAAWRFGSAATVSAAIAAGAVLMLTPMQTMTTNSKPVVVASATKPASRTDIQPVASRARINKRLNNSATVAPVAFTPPPLARPDTTHVDGLEAAPGHQVATWVQPRTNARVIWIQGSGIGAPVRLAGLDR